MVQKKGPKAQSKKKRPLKVNREGEEDDGRPEERVLSHKHCFNCGLSIGPNKETCSDKCQVEWDKMMKKKKFWNYLPLLGAAFLALLWIIMSMA